MESMLLAIFHIAFVTAVYCAAYRQGLRSAQAETRAMVEQFSYPISELMEKLDRKKEKAAESEGPPKGN